MFRVYTRHTQEVDETVMEHFWFTFKLGTFMVSSGVLLLIHGLTAGLLPTPESMSIEGVRKKMNRIADQRENKKKLVARAARTRQQLENLYSLKEGNTND
tara:strand:+ start:96 stop:395 length:300 start_codon:yes stop_codon:yes gene_type:complete